MVQGPATDAEPTLQDMFGGLTQMDFEALSPRAGIDIGLENLFGQSAMDAGPIQGFLRNQAFGLIPAQQFGTLAGLVSGQLPSTARATSFGDYLQNLQLGGGGLQGGFTQALENLQSIRGVAPGALPQNVQGASYIFNPQSEADTGAAIRLLGAAQRGRYSPFVSSIFRTPTESELFAGYARDADRRAREGQAARNFLDFAAGSFGL